MQTHTKIFAAILSLSAAVVTGQALAAGMITGVTTSKANLDLGQSMTADVAGKAMPDQFKKGCAIRVSLKYADNSVEVVHPHLLADYFPSTGFYLKPTKAGKVTVIADGGPNSPSGYPACQGSAQATVQVAAPIVVNPHPNIQVRPAASTTPQGDIQVVQLPASALQVTTLKSIKQVQYTEHSGETWIEVQGTGNCTFTIDSAGVPTSTFSSSAAKPFPMKVKIAGAPLGFHQWKAKGTGNCNGEASASFSVE